MELTPAIKIRNNIYTGERHTEAFIKAREAEEEIFVFADAEQGFVNQEGAFFSREESAEIAMKEGLTKFLINPPFLNSSDLY